MGPRGEDVRVVTYACGKRMVDFGANGRRIYVMPDGDETPALRDITQSDFEEEVVRSDDAFLMVDNEG